MKIQRLFYSLIPFIALNIFAPQALSQDIRLEEIRAVTVCVQEEGILLKTKSGKSLCLNSYVENKFGYLTDEVTRPLYVYDYIKDQYIFPTEVLSLGESVEVCNYSPFGVLKGNLSARFWDIENGNFIGPNSCREFKAEKIYYTTTTISKKVPGGIGLSPERIMLTFAITEILGGQKLLNEVEAYIRNLPSYSRRNTLVEFAQRNYLSQRQVEVIAERVNVRIKW